MHISYPRNKPAFAGNARKTAEETPLKKPLTPNLLYIVFAILIKETEVLEVCTLDLTLSIGKEIHQPEAPAIPPAMYTPNGFKRRSVDGCSTNPIPSSSRNAGGFNELAEQNIQLSVLLKIVVHASYAPKNTKLNGTSRAMVELRPRKMPRSPFSRYASRRIRSGPTSTTTHVYCRLIIVKIIADAKYFCVVSVF